VVIITDQMYQPQSQGNNMDDIRDGNTFMKMQIIIFCWLDMTDFMDKASLHGFKPHGYKKLQTISNTSQLQDVYLYV
jgi:hypothetical protein